MSRRGQITLFIIVGIVLLLVIGLTVAAWKFINYEKPPEEQIQEEVNTELKPLSELVRSCVEHTTDEVFEQIGLHGGYYDPEAVGFVSLPTRPTESSALEPFAGQLVPYWRHMSSRNDCTECQLASEQPPLEGSQFPAIEAQAEEAIAAEVMSCLDDFAGLEQQYTITPQSEPRVDVVFTEDSVISTLHYTIDVQTSAGSQSTLRQFSVTTDIPIKRLYGYAYGIRNATEVVPFFEGMTLDTITLESVGDPEPIPPPYGDTDISYDPGPFWILMDVQRRLAERFEENTALVQVLGSEDMDFVNTGDAVTDNQYANYYLALSDPAPQAQASFLYLSSWGEPYVRITPGGQVIKPLVVPTILDIIPPIKRKEFFYDVSYPVLVQLNAPRAQGEYFFQFALEVNMRGNEELDYSDPGFSDLSLCDPAFASGSQLALSVQDVDGRPINAEVHYSCLTDSCSLGTARAGELSAQLPVCIGGAVSAERQGYRTVSEELDSLGEDARVVLTMQRYTDVQINPQQFFLQKAVSGVSGTSIETSWSLTDQASDISWPEQLVLVFTPLDDPTGAQAAVFPDGRDTIALAPGEYSVTGVLLQELSEPKVLAGKEVCGLAGVVGCSTIPDVPLGATSYTDDEGNVYDVGSSTMYIGGLEWSENTKTVTITQSMLDRGVLDVPVIAIYLPHMVSIDDIDVLDLIDDFSVQLSLS